MRNTQYFLTLTVMWICFLYPAPGVAGRYVCVDKDGKEIVCVVEKNERKPTRKSSVSPSQKPAGKPYKHHKKGNQPQKK